MDSLIDTARKGKAFGAGHTPITEAAALMRIAASGITLAQARGMSDDTLLRFPLIGRRTLRFIREQD